MLLLTNHHVQTAAKDAKCHLLKKDAQVLSQMKIKLADIIQAAYVSTLLEVAKISIISPYPCETIVFNTLERFL